MPNYIFQDQLYQINTGNKLQSPPTVGHWIQRVPRRTFGYGESYVNRQVRGVRTRMTAFLSVSGMSTAWSTLANENRYLHSISIHSRKERQMGQLPLSSSHRLRSILTSHHVMNIQIPGQQEIWETCEDPRRMGGWSIEAMCIKTLIIKSKIPFLSLILPSCMILGNSMI